MAPSFMRHCPRLQMDVKREDEDRNMDQSEMSLSAENVRNAQDRPWT